MWRQAALLVMALGGCGDDATPAGATTDVVPPVPDEPPVDPQRERHVIAANAEARVGDVRIGAGSFWERTFTDDGGHERTGLTCGLWVSVEGHPEAFEHHIGYPGLELDHGGYHFRVRRVDADRVIVDSELLR